MKQKIRYTPNETNDLCSKEQIVFIDIRDTEHFQKGHIPGAVHVPEIFTYLSESTPEGLENLHKKYKELFSQAGLSPDKTVIVYEDSLHNRYGGSCRGYWLLTYLGHEKTGILDGGFTAWIKAGLPVTTQASSPELVEFKLDVRPDIMATMDDVLKSIDDPSVTLLDDRDRVEWIGESSSPYGVDFAPRKGRIPGAKWIEWYEFMDRTLDIPAFKTKDEIKTLCARHGIYPDNDIIVYCFKGSRASNTYVALKESGFKKVRVYYASWNEWSRHPELPIEEGPPKE
ncbi:MAG: sulfurtransferase [Candidatus Brocadiaceae bacterium]|nr:sulfurtransferase [Candidatus Brocadiaceae bacterium]